MSALLPLSPQPAQPVIDATRPAGQVAGRADFGALLSGLDGGSTLLDSPVEPEALTEPPLDSKPLPDSTALRDDVPQSAVVSTETTPMDAIALALSAQETPGGHETPDVLEVEPSSEDVAEEIELTEEESKMFEETSSSVLAWLGNASPIVDPALVSPEEAGGKVGRVRAPEIQPSAAVEADVVEADVSFEAPMEAGKPRQQAPMVDGVEGVTAEVEIAESVPKGRALAVEPSPEALVEGSDAEGFELQFSSSTPDRLSVRVEDGGDAIDVEIEQVDEGLQVRVVTPPEALDEFEALEPELERSLGSRGLSLESYSARARSEQERAQAEAESAAAQHGSDEDEDAQKEDSSSPQRWRGRLLDIRA